MASVRNYYFGIPYSCLNLNRSLPSRFWKWKRSSFHFQSEKTEKRGLFSQFRPTENSKTENLTVFIFRIVTVRNGLKNMGGSPKIRIPLSVPPFREILFLLIFFSSFRGSSYRKLKEGILIWTWYRWLTVGVARAPSFIRSALPTLKITNKGSGSVGPNLGSKALHPSAPRASTQWFQSSSVTPVMASAIYQFTTAYVFL